MLMGVGAFACRRVCVVASGWWRRDGGVGVVGRGPSCGANRRPRVEDAQVWTWRRGPRQASPARFSPHAALHRRKTTNEP